MEKPFTIIIITTLVIFIQYYSTTVCFSEQVTSLTDEEALLALKAQIILDPQNILAKNWSNSVSFCNWFGVYCSSRHKRVRALTLPGMSLNGTLPPHLGNLSFLTTLDLQNNNFHGNLPPELANLRRLKSMILINNYFTGGIPEQIGYLPRLEKLFLGGNSLSGSIPLTVFNMSSLQRIFLATNNLEGSVPGDLCDHLPLLQVLEISFNNLSGKISPTLQRCRLLQILGLSNNRFTGSIPRELGNLTMLTELYLGFNNLEGEIPRELSRLVGLERFAVENSGLTGRLPLEMFNISSLKDFVVMNNSLSGNLPADLCHRLPNLEKVFFYDNKLDGDFPRDIGNCTLLKQLRLGRNNFTEYGSTGVVSTKGDVYNYGILVMETFTGRKPTNEMFAGEMNLKCWVKESLPDAITEVADAYLLEKDEDNFMAKTSCISSVMQLALDCCAESPAERKDMKDVVVSLKKIKDKFLKDTGRA